MFFYWIAACGDDATDSKIPGSPSGEDRLEILSVTAEAHAERVTEVAVSWELSEAAEVRVSCVADEDPTEVHLATTGALTTTFYGLLPGADYTCSVSTLDDRLSFPAPVRTGVWPGAPAVTVEGDPDAIGGGYTLFNVGDVCGGAMPAWVYVADPHGRLRWAYQVPEDIVPDLVATHVGGGRFLLGGGTGIIGLGDSALRLVGLDWVEAWSRELPVTGLDYNHHVEMLDDGDVLSLVWVENFGELGQFVGFGIERFDPVTEDAVFDWSSQQALDAGALPPGSFGSDAYHANALAYVGDDPLGPSYWVSLANLNVLVRVDAVTGALTHTVGSGLGFTLYGLDGGPDDQWFSFQHAIRVTALSDGTYAVTMHDNGHNTGQTRLLDLAVDLAGKSVTVTWNWTEPDWYEYAGGDHDVLLSGHRLATQGHAECYGGNDRDSAITEVDPADGSVLWRLVFPERTSFLYRSDRIEGCDLFANAKYCPELAAGR